MLMKMPLPAKPHVPTLAYLEDKKVYLEKMRTQVYVLT